MDSSGFVSTKTLEKTRHHLENKACVIGYLYQ